MKEYRIETEIIPPLLAWYDGAKRILPWRGTKDPYNIWVSEIMLQQTRVEAVNHIMTGFCRHCRLYGILQVQKNPIF